MPQLLQKGREKHLSFRAHVGYVGAHARALRTAAGHRDPRLLLLCWQYYLTVLEVGIGVLKDERSHRVKEKVKIWGVNLS